DARARTGRRRRRRVARRRPGRRGRHRRQVRRTLSCDTRRESGGRGRYPRPALLRPRDRNWDLRPPGERSNSVKTRWLAIAALVGALALAAGLGMSKANASSHKSTALSGKISIVGVWTGAEQKAFQAVLNGFTAKNPGVKVSYKSTGDNTPTVLSTAVAGGNPPDLASVSQPGLVKDFQKKGALKNLDFAKGALAANYPPGVVTIGKIDGHTDALRVKGANKSPVWYTVASFKAAGVKPPKTWGDFTKAI